MNEREALRREALRAEAADLLKQSRSLRQRSQNPDAAGSGIRADWAKRADVLLAEAQVLATLGAGNE